MYHNINLSDEPMFDSTLPKWKISNTNIKYETGNYFDIIWKGKELKINYMKLI